VGAISPSAFLTRDFIEYVFPATVATCLFLPFSRDGSIGLEILVGGSVLVSYILGSIRDTLSGISWIDGSLINLHLHPPASRERKESESEDENSWQAGNWDYDLLFYSLSKDDREYIYLTAAYRNMSYALSLYLLLYGIVNLFWLGGCLLIKGWIFELAWSDLALRTPILGGKSAPAILLLLLSYLALNSLYSWYIKESESLFGDFGMYNQFARRVQRETGNLATSVWGRVLRGEVPIERAIVELIVDGQSHGRERTDEKGRFQFKGAYRTCLGRQCRFQVYARGLRREIEIQVASKEVPEFDIQLMAPKPREGSSILSWVRALWRL
jgi:hypothetical protein